VEEKLELARKSGADLAINSITAEKPFEKALSTLVISGANAAYDGALDMTANHGAVLAVGLPPSDLQISGMFIHIFWTIYFILANVIKWLAGVPRMLHSSVSRRAPSTT
jgi:D-arabinose 1-dehydrogenase-like Zn-dependent alcohol dehydrogenase